MIKIIILIETGLVKQVLFLLLLTLLSISNSYAKNSEVVTEFLLKTFSQKNPIVQRLWINKEKMAIIKRQHNPSHINLSYKYWQQGNLTVWILNQIGKERNITTGIVIQEGTIKNVEILVYRETRGGQVQNKRFTQQYNSKNSQSNLIKEIDSISGATLSVNALNRQVKLALWLDSIK